MKRLSSARSVAFALAPLVVLAPRVAAAQIDPVDNPDAETTEATPTPSKPDTPGASHGVARVALVGGYRSLFDLDVLGGGLQLSYGSDAPISGQANLRILGGRTLGGLDGAAFSVTRATNGGAIVSFGPEGVVRLGYDLAPHHALFILADVDFELQAGPSAVWGPTLAVGYRF